MNGNPRELWFSILQAGVLAPWLWRESAKEKNPYFAVGLKLVGSAILLGNLPPILSAARQVALQYEAMRTAQPGSIPPERSTQAFRTASQPMTATGEFGAGVDVLTGGSAF